MAKEYSLVRGDTLATFNADCTTKLNSGFTCVGGIAKYGENNREYLQAFQKDTANNTPLITINNAQMVINFGNVAQGESGVSVNLGIVGTYITGNITPTLSGLNTSDFSLVGDGVAIAPDGNGNIDTTKEVNAVVAGDSALGQKEAYISLATDNGQTVNVILKVTVVAP